MKEIILLLYFISAGIIQTNFTDFKSNATRYDKEHSLIYSSFYGKKDFVLAYTIQSFWSDQKTYYAIANTSNKWEKITLTSKRKKDGSWTKPRIQIKGINEQQVETTLDNLSRDSFWDLDRRHLTNITYKDADSVLHKVSRSDGVNYRIEIFTKEKFRVIEAYEPEYYLDKMPEKRQREVFINSRKQIEALLINGT